MSKMSEEISKFGKDQFDYLKQWLFSKHELHIPSFVDNRNTDSPMVARRGNRPGITEKKISQNADETNQCTNMPNAPKYHRKIVERNYSDPPKSGHAEDSSVRRAFNNVGGVSSVPCIHDPETYRNMKEDSDGGAVAFATNKALPRNYDWISKCGECGQWNVPIGGIFVHNTLGNEYRTENGKKIVQNGHANSQMPIFEAQNSSNKRWNPKNERLNLSARMVKAASNRTDTTKSLSNLDRVTQNDTVGSPDQYMQPRTWSLSERKSRGANNSSQTLRRKTSQRYRGNDGSKRSDETHSDETPCDDITNYIPEVTCTTTFVNGRPLDMFTQQNVIHVPSVYGQIKIMFQYLNERNEFFVMLLEGSNIARWRSGTLAVFAKVSLMPNRYKPQKGCVKQHSHNPIFYEAFSFNMGFDEIFDRQLQVKLYTKPGLFRRPEPLGKCSIPLSNYDLTAVTVTWFNLKKCRNQKDDFDNFDFSLFEGGRRNTTGRFRSLLCGCQSR